MSRRKEMRQGERRHREKRGEYGKASAKHTTTRVGRMEWVCGKLQQALKVLVVLGGGIKK